jgi:hypothetical protein
MSEGYKFPDEADMVVTSEDSNDDGFKVEVVDDTPEQDRGRKPLPKEIVDELDKDDLEEYSEKVKKRLSQMKKVWHDERRAKEEAAREREEAIRFAQAQFEENKKLKQRLGTGEKILVEQATKNVNADLAAAKDKFKQAYESGDSDKLTEAQEELTEAKLKLREFERYKPSLQDEEEGVQQTPQTEQPVRIDPKAAAWQQKNTWFGQDEEMTALALGLHQKLVKRGIDTGSDDYYREIDTTMRRRFPETFGGESNSSQEQERPASRNKQTTIVAPASRSSAPKQIRLSASAVALAKKFGISPEQYAREVLKLENNNG